MNKYIKKGVVGLLSLLLITFPIIIPFSNMAEAQAQNKVNTIDAAPKGIQLNSSAYQALVSSKYNYNMLNMVEMAQEKPLIKVSRRDAEHVKNKEIDRRVLKTVNYLVTPREFGGAGYTRLKIKKLMKGYDTRISSRKVSREYPEDTKPNVSAHSRGQGVDIEEIDYIYSVLKKYRVAGDKKQVLPTMPIKVAWQTEKGFQDSRGMDTFNQSLQGTFSQFGFDQLNSTMLYEVADLFGIEIDLNDYSLNNLEDLTKILALQWLVSSADIPGLDLNNIDFSDMSWESLVKEMGRSYLGNLLGLDPAGLRGNGLSEIKRNLGRVETESRLELPEGSLETSSGNTDDILRQMLIRELEDDLELSKGSLKDLDSKPEDRKLLSDSLDIYRNNRLDEALSLPEGTINILTGTSSGNISETLLSAGVDLASRIIANNPDEQALVKTWIQSKGTTTNNNGLIIDEGKLAGGLGLKAGDLENIFIKNGAFAVFNRLGETTLLSGMGHAALENYDPLNSTVAQIQFYVDTAKDLKSQLENLKNDSDIGETVNGVLSIINQLSVILDVDTANVEQDINKLNDAARSIQNISDLSDSDLDSIQKIENSINSFIEGVDLPFLPDVGSADLDIPNFNIYGNDISTTKVLNALLSNDPVDSLEVVGKEILSNQWEFAWGLPNNAFDALINGNSNNNIREALGIIASDYINDEFGLNISGSDLENIFNGDFDSLIDIGGSMIDEALNLPKNSVSEVIRKGGTAEEIIQETGALLISQFFGINTPIDLDLLQDGKFGESLGSGIVETRLGIPIGTLKDYSDLDAMISKLGIQRVSEIFHLTLNGASKINSSIIDNSTEGILYVARILGVNTDHIKSYLQGGSTGDFVRDVGEGAAISLTAEKLAHYLGLDDSLIGALTDILLGPKESGDLDPDIDRKDLGILDPSGLNWNDVAKLIPALSELAGFNLEQYIGFNADEMQKILDGSENFEDVIIDAGIRLFENYLEDLSGNSDFQLFGFLLWYYLESSVNEGSDKWSPEQMPEKLAKFQANDQNMADEFKGILDGNAKDFLYSVASGQMQKSYNEEFLGIDNITFGDVKNALTGDPQLMSEWLADPENAVLVDGMPEQEKQEFAGRAARKEGLSYIKYKLMDAQLHEHLDEEIPPGFSETMFEGTPEERREMLLDFVIDKYGSELITIIKNETGIDINISGLKQAINTGDWEQFGEDTLINFVSGKLNELTGINFHPHTIRLLLDGDISGAIDVNKVLISKFVDDWLGLPAGTTQVIWQAYDSYRSALSAYKAAKIAAAGDATLLSEAKAQFRTDIAQIVAVVVTYLFRKQLAKLDQQFGLPAGTMSALVGLAITYLIAGSVPIIGWIALAYTLLTGVYRVRVRTTPCNYYPGFGSPPAWMKMEPEHPDELGILPSSFPYCPREWSYKPKFSGSVFKDIAVDSAQYKVAMLVGDLLYMNENLEAQGDKIAGKNKGMQPVQILTHREEDRNRYLYKVLKEYGKTASERGQKGVIVSDKTWDVVHVGY